MGKLHPTGIIWIWAIQIFCFALAYIATSNRSRIMVLEKGRSEMTAFFKCDNCGRKIKDTRIQIVDDDQGEPEFLYYFVGDDEGEEVDKHYCAKCLAFLLVGHGEQEEVEAGSEEESEEGEAEK